MPVKLPTHIVLFFLLLLPLFSLAQQPYMRQITDEEGLPSLTVYDLYQDDKDYLWVGTDKGLCRYDGHQFQYYDIAEAEAKAIKEIYIDSRANIWCKNLQNQLFRLVGDSLELFEFSALGLPNFKVLDFAFGEDRLMWILTDQGLFEHKIGERTFKKLPIPQTDYQSLKLDAEQQLWLCAKDELYILSPKGSHSIDLKSYELDKAPKIILQQASIFLIQQQEETTEIYKLEEDQLKAFPQYPNLKLEGILENKDKEYWVYGFGGLYRQKNIEDTPKKIIQEHPVSKVLQDREGNHWVSTLGAGIYFIPQPDIRYYSRYNSQLEAVKISRLVLDAQKNLIIGTDGQQHPIFSPQQETQIGFYPSPTLSALKAIYWDEDGAGLYLYQQQLYHYKQPNSPPTGILNLNTVAESIENYDQEHLIIATEDGAMLVRKDFGRLNSELLSKFPKAQFENQQKQALIFTKAKCQKVFIEEDNIWLAYADSLFLCNKNECQAILDQNGNPIRVRDITQTDDGTIWLASISQGLLGLVNAKIQYVFNKDNGLKSTTITSLATDGNNLWLGTDRGIQHLNSNRQSFSTYDKQDGLLSNEIEDLLILKDEIWAASPKGLINFKQNLSSINAYPPPIYPRKFTVNGEEQKLAEQYQLQYNQNNITIGFQGIAYRAMQNFRYKYRLKGFSDVWYYIDGTEEALRFSALPPGRYLFEIRALNEDGVLSTEALRISFVILRPFWQQWWFIAIIVAAIAILVSSLLWWRLLIRQRFLGRINILKMQALQAQMNPHFVFNALNAIQTLMLTDDLELAMGYLSKFAKLIRVIFNVSNLPSIDLQEEIQFLKLYTDLEQLRFGDKIKIEFEIDPILEKEEYYIPPLLIQPIIENSFKHGLLHKKELGALKILLKKEGQFLYVIIEDDGVGRAKAEEANQWKKEEKKQSSGLSITSSRLNLLKNSTKYNPNPKLTDLYNPEGKAVGTKVELWIPFQKAADS
jgi:ligand-binding sensor domain-containing protein